MEAQHIGSAESRRLWPNSFSPMWRYMDFTKFASMLSTESLYFCRADNFNDIHEAEPTFNSKLEIAETLIGNGNATPLSRAEDIFKTIKQNSFVNCWHENDKESYAMWKMFVDGANGVAITTNPRALFESIKGVPSQFELGCYRVAYGDLMRDWNASFDMKSFATVKWFWYSYEQEIRLLLTPDDLIEVAARVLDEGYHPPTNDGLNVGFDLSKLITGIIVSPSSPEWYLKLVQEMTEKYGINKKVRRSLMDYGAKGR